VKAYKIPFVRILDFLFVLCVLHFVKKEQKIMNTRLDSQNEEALGNYKTSSEFI